MGKVTERQKPIKEKLLVGLRRGWSVSGAARYAGISRRQFLTWREEDEVFNIACLDAIEEGNEGLEDVAVGRAKRKSDVLLMFLMKGRDKARYGDQAASSAVVNVTVKRFSK